MRYKQEALNIKIPMRDRTWVTGKGYWIGGAQALLVCKSVPQRSKRMSGKGPAYEVRFVHLAGSINAGSLCSHWQLYRFYDPVGSESMKAANLCPALLNRETALKVAEDLAGPLCMLAGARKIKEADLPYLYPFVMPHLSVEQMNDWALKMNLGEQSLQEVFYAAAAKCGFKRETEMNDRVFKVD